MGLAINLVVANTETYASRESVHTAEFVGRLGGGFSVVTVDDQGAGRLTSD